MEKKEMCKILKPYTCPICGKETLFFSNGKNIFDYKSMVTKDKLSNNQIVNKLQYEKIKYIKCINCNRDFIIDWRRRWPTILQDPKALNQFGI